MIVSVTPTPPVVIVKDDKRKKKKKKNPHTLLMKYSISICV